MKKICFLIPDGILKPSSLFGAIEVFEKANEFALEKNGKAFYKIIVAGVSPKQDLLNGMLSIKVCNIEDVKAPDLIIVPSLQPEKIAVNSKNKKLLQWVIFHYKKGAEIASLCTGVFFLAGTGLLKNMECSTHWKAENLFTKMFPDVKLRVDKIITDNNGIYSAGGASSSLNLAVYLVEKYQGREAAIYCAKILQIDIERSSQSQFILFEGQKNHPDEQIKKIQGFIEKNIEERITVDYLADKFSISKRSLVRRFKKATNNPPIEYIQRIKIEVAKRRLEAGFDTVNEIMYTVGYNDIKAFRNIFKKITGISPVDYRNKFNKEYAAQLTN
jgi:transcriptional regulator GlxA family with amidase domain